MNILVLSDSHGNISNMEEAVEREKPDMILHLGDCWRDAERLAERYPDIPMEHVPGNCDCRPEEPAEKLLFLGDCRVLICHGNILRSLEKARYINGFHRSNGAYYTTITPFVEEL